MEVTFSKHDALWVSARTSRASAEIQLYSPLATLATLTSDVKQTEGHVANLEARFGDTGGFGADSQHVLAGWLVVGSEEAIKVLIKAGHA